MKFIKSINENNFDVLVITETWFCLTSPSRLFNTDDYTFINSDRSHQRGGGVAIYVRNGLKIEIMVTSVVANNKTEHLF